MKPYMSPAACSLSPHIVLHEAGFNITPIRVNRKSRKMNEEGDSRSVNPKDYVPALQRDGGAVLTEGPAIVQKFADQAPASGPAPAIGTIERYRLQEWLNFIGPEIPGQFSSLFDPAASDEVKQKQRDRLVGRFDWLNEQREGKDNLMGKHFTVADAYLLMTVNWSQWTGIDPARWPLHTDDVNRVAARPKVLEALNAEGLVQ